MNPARVTACAAALFFASNTSFAQEGLFNGLLNQQICRTLRLVQCADKFCAVVATQGLPSLTLDFGDSTFGVPEFGEVGSLTVVETSSSEIGKPLWVRFTFQPSYLNGRIANATVGLIPDQNGGGYRRFISYSSTGLENADGSDKPNRAIGSGTCEAA